MSRERWGSVLLAATLSTALLFPPDVYPESGALCCMWLALGLWLVPRRTNWGWSLGALALLGFNLAVSLAPLRSVAFWPRLALPAAVFALVLSLRESRRTVLFSIALSGGTLGLYAWLQKLLLMPHDLAVARAGGAASEVIVRLASGRPFATHALPASLAGALLLAIAALLALWQTEPRYRRWLAALLLLSGSGLILTASLGAFAALLVVATIIVLPRWRRWSWQGQLASVVVPAAILALLVSLRPVSVIDLQRADNPLLLRVGNWRGACLAATESPIAGIGLGAYGSIAPHYRRAGDQETLYAHNSWLQLAVEGGLPVVALLLVVLLWSFRGWRRARGELGQLFLWGGCAAFLIHNLFDFTAYLPGVSIAALALIASLRSAPPASGSLAPQRLGAVALLLLSVVFGAEAAARRSLEEHPARAAHLAAWSPPILLAAGNVALQQHDLIAAEQVAAQLIEGDPESPAGWHLLGEVRREQKRPGDAWRALAMAALRHPGDLELKQELDRFEAAMQRAGLWQQPLSYGASARPIRFPWQLWDDLLLIGALSCVAIIVMRRGTPNAAPIEAVLLGLLLLLLPWGEGGALPGVRLARAFIIAAALICRLFPPRGVAGSDAERFARVPLLLLAPALVLCALSTALAPDPASSRDGLMTLVAAAAALALSWDLSRRLARWPTLVLNLFLLAASLTAALWVLQSIARWSGLSLASAPTPLRVEDATRPAADFLHPGHLGTFLVAAGAAAVGSALFGAGSKLRLGLGVSLLVVGLAGGARGSILALLAAGVGLAWISADRGRRRMIVWGLCAAVPIGVGFVAWRFRAGDPYMWRRLSIWRAALGALRERLWFGFGPGGFDNLGVRYAFDDPGPIAHFGRSFSGPHSDLLGAFIAAGLGGGLVLLLVGGTLLWRGIRTARLAQSVDPALVGSIVAVICLVAHGLADDLFGARPAAAISAAILLGAVAGARLERQTEVTLTPTRRWTTLLLTLLAFGAGEVAPWAADRFARGGEPTIAAHIDRARAAFWIEAARDASGAAMHQAARALDRSARAVRVSPLDPAVWRERALVLDALCRGPLNEAGSCEAALHAWQQAAELRPHDALLRYGLAHLADRMQQSTLAAAELERAIADEPNFLAARLALAHLRLRAGDKLSAQREAQQLIDRARRLEGLHPESDYEMELLRIDRPSWSSLLEALK